MSSLLRSFAVLTWVLLGLSFTQAQQSPSDTSRFLGSVHDGVYINDHFGFRIKIPSGWQPITEQEKKQAEVMVTELMKAEGTDYVPAKFSSITLLHLRKKKIGEQGNALFRILVTKQPNATITPLMAARATRAMLLGNPMANSVGEIKEHVISGRKFTSIEFTVRSTSEREIKSRYLGTVERGYSIAFVFTHVVDEDEKSLRDIYESLAFK